MTLAEPPSVGDRGLLRWAGAFVVVLAAHGLVAALLLDRAIAPSASEAPPAPIMIDLPEIAQSAPSLASEQSVAADAAEPTPTLEPTEEPAIQPPEAAEPVEAAEAETDPPEEAPAQAAETLPAVPAEEAPPEAPTLAAQLPPSETKPVEPTTAAEIPPDEVPLTPVPEALVAAAPPEETAPPVPAARPTPPPPTREPARERPVRREAPKPTQRVVREQPKRPQKPTAAPPSAVPAARDSTASVASAAGRPNPSELGRYVSQLRAALERQKRFPAEARASRAEGVATVRFTVSRSGGVMSAALARSSGHSALDQAALAMVRQADFPSAPASLPGPSFTVSAPVRFDLD